MTQKFNIDLVLYYLELVLRVIELGGDYDLENGYMEIVSWIGETLALGKTCSDSTHASIQKVILTTYMEIMVMCSRKLG